MRFRGAPDEPSLAFLPWGALLEEWPEDEVVSLPRGISRHVVRFVRRNGTVYAIKECEEAFADREYELLVDLQRRGLPTVEPVAVVAGRVDDSGEALPAALITKHLAFSLPYRALFSSTLREGTAVRLLDALAVLLIQLHLVGFSWNDCSLSNTLFVRDAGSFAAYLVDAETGELHERLSDGQRQYDLETASVNIAGELMDLAAGGRLQEDIDPIVVGASIRERYDRLWSEVTQPIVITRDDRHTMERHIRLLNELGFDVAELHVATLPDGEHVHIQPKVVDVGHHSRRLLRLTGIDAEEHQARRLLNDLDSYRIKLGLPTADEEFAAHRWVTERYELVMQAVPASMRGRLEPAEIFHEVLEHRWYLGERTGHSVPFAMAVSDYVQTVLPRKPDEATVLGARVDTDLDDTAAMRIVFPQD